MHIYAPWLCDLGVLVQEVAGAIDAHVHLAPASKEGQC